KPSASAPTWINTASEVIGAPEQSRALGKRQSGNIDDTGPAVGDQRSAADDGAAATDETELAWAALLGLGGRAAAGTSRQTR
ncbi:hypothetical protein K28_00440, partial [Klebsiella pneumoniae]